MTINVPANALEGALNDGAVAFEINAFPSECGITTLADGNPSGLRLGIIVK